MVVTLITHQGTSTVAMVHEDTSDNMTLYAAPGRFTKITQDSITIAEGEKFKVWTGVGDRDVYYTEMVVEQVIFQLLVTVVLSLTFQSKLACRKWWFGSLDFR